MHARDDVTPRGPADPDWRSLPPAAQVDAAVDTLRMLADPTRLRMLWLLCGGEHDVTTLATAVGIARPAVSQHLGKLRLAGLVTTYRDGRRALYHARGRHVRQLLAEAVTAPGPEADDLSG